MPAMNSGDLEERVRNACQAWPGAAYSAAAYEIVVGLTSFQIREQHFADFGLAVRHPRKGDFRLLQLGESVFAMRNHPLLDELSRRLHERPLRSVFFEFAAAAFCVGMGFQAVPSPGHPAKGSDYDFGLVGPQQIGPVFLIDSAIPFPRINVEVTEFQAKEAITERLANRLKSKSKQVPDDAPSVLFCYYPFGWQTLSEGWRDVLAEAAKLLFKGSRRINWVVFIAEFVGGLPSGEDADYVQHFIALKNPSPRHMAVRLDVAIQNRVEPERSQARLMQHRLGLKQWVDNLATNA